MNTLASLAYQWLCGALLKRMGGTRSCATLAGALVGAQHSPLLCVNEGVSIANANGQLLPQELKQQRESKLFRGEICHYSANSMATQSWGIT